MRRVVLLGFLWLAGCAQTGPDVARLDGPGVAALLPAIAQAPSGDFAGGERPDYRVITRDGPVTPQMLTTPAQIRVRRGPGAKVFLAGSPEGTAPIAIDDFLLIEVENPAMPSGLSRIVAGAVKQVEWGKVPVENRAPVTPIRAGAVDLTDLIPPCASRLVSVVAMDGGVVAASDAVYLIIADDARHKPVQPADCRGRFGS